MDSKNKVSSNKINVNIYNEDVYADFGYEGHEMLDEGMVNTLTTLSNSRPIKHKLDIVFNASKNMQIDENRLKRAYKNTFVSLIDNMKHQIARCIVTGLIMFAIGMLALLFTVLVARKQSTIFGEFCNIVTWVFAWGGVEILTVQLVQLEIEKAKYKRLLKSNVIIENKQSK